ncbi:MAG: 2-hydroxyacyl-CoA dehydratase, partial [Candidatus Tectomicrobia bacterium]|nr:2-hydroxyacyl-CoA dehydratase [Candidatus Tectomicrobia bacterium]
MATSQRYQTKPLDCWTLSKELRAKFYQEIWTAKERGKTVALGLGLFSNSLPTSLPDTIFAEMATYFTSIANNPPQAIEFAETVSSRGYPADICHAAQLVWGSMFLDQGPMGPFLRPDFCIQLHFCETQGKSSQIMSEYFNIPHFCIDSPLIPLGRDKEHFKRNVVAQMQDAIAWMEKVTGKIFNDEEYVKRVRNEWEVSVLWAKICELNKNIPAPLDIRMLSSLSAPIFLNRSSDETVRYLQILHAEVQDRVKNKIAALGTERCRLLHEGVPPFHFLKLFRVPEKYGAIFIGSSLDFGACGAFDRQEDGSWTVAKTPEELGMPMKTREDALRAAAHSFVNDAFTRSLLVVGKTEEQIKRVEGWQVDGVVFH